MEPLIDTNLRSIIPLLAPEEYKALEESIIAEGCRDALVIWEEKGVIVDGHNRYDICTKFNIPYRTFSKSFANRDETMLWIIDNQLARRNLNPYQRVVLNLKRKETIAKQAKDNQGTRTDIFPNSGKCPIDTEEEIAKLAKVGHDTIWKVEQIEEKAPEEWKEKLRTGESSINEVYQDIKTLSRLQPEQQVKVLNMVIAGQAKNVITARKLLYREEVANIKPPEGKYQVIYADPPWEYDFGFDIHGAASRHYNTMTIDELCDLPIKDLADDNSVLFLWVTSPKLREAFPVIDAWGFEYKTSFVWDKIKHVMGHYNSVRHEFLLLCIRGSFPKQSNTLHDSVITIERSDNHSEKPEYFRTLISDLYPQAKKIELFTSKAMPGWEPWGSLCENNRTERIREEAI